MEKRHFDEIEELRNDTVAAVLAETIASAENAVLLDNIALLTQRLHQFKQEQADIYQAGSIKHPANSRIAQSSMNISNQVEISQNFSDLCESRQQQPLLALSKGLDTLGRHADGIGGEETIISEVLLV